MYIFVSIQTLFLDPVSTWCEIVSVRAYTFSANFVLADVVKF